MKKVFLAILSIAVLASSCSKDEVIDMPAKKAISFKNSFVDPSVKAAIDPSLTSGTLQDFKVYGFEQSGANKVNIFNGVTVTRGGTGTGTSWTYAGTPRYWILGNSYDFAAIAPASFTSADIVCDALGMPTTINYSLSDNNPIDLLYATADRNQDGSEIDATDISFTFRHALAKLKFTFTNGFAASSGYKIEVRNIKISGVKSSAVCSLSSRTWTLPGTGTMDLTFGTTGQIAEASAAESQYEKLIIPNTTGADENFAISCTVDLLFNGVIIGTYNHAHTLSANFLSNKSYNITSTIDIENVNPTEQMKPITFFVNEVVSWETMPNTSVQDATH